MITESFTDIVILAGGIGERLWPASVPERPKQFLSVDGELSFLQSSVQRALSLEPSGKILIITRDSFAEEVSFQCRELAKKLQGTKKDKILKDLIIVAEPQAKHTCAPLMFACRLLELFDSRKHLILTLASDHVISTTGQFIQDCNKASVAAANGYFVCFAIPPLFPATGYGYIKIGESLPFEKNVFSISNFKEKPDINTAASYLKEGNYFWNSGMFAFSAEFFINEVKKCEPDIYESFSLIKDISLPQEKTINGIHFIQGWKPLEDSYSKTPSVAVDNAIAEKTEKAVAVKALFDWDDVGSWDSFEKHIAAKNLGKSVCVGGEGNFIYSDLPVAVCGLSNVTVVVKNGKVLVMDKKSSSLMRDVVNKARECFI